jgi:hypothetical protein
VNVNAFGPVIAKGRGETAHGHLKLHLRSFALSWRDPTYHLFEEPDLAL